MFFHNNQINMQILSVILSFSFVWMVHANITVNELRLDLGSATSYHGIVKESERDVEVEPALRVTHPEGVEICHYRVVNKRHGEVPFHISVIDRHTGEASIRATKPLNCEKRRHYKFDIAAVACDDDDKLSDSATILIDVDDVNEWEPYFERASYDIDVDEGRLYDKILTIKAYDDDCSQNFGDICKYEIITPSQPFVIDAEGNMKNTEALDWSASRNHILAVVAYDCGLKRSKSVNVNIRVNRVCTPGWKGIPDQLEYSPSSGLRLLSPQAHLDLCPPSGNSNNVGECDEVDEVDIKVSLSTSHIGKGCDRDTYSVESQRKICGASTSSVDLLPTATTNLPTDDGSDADHLYSFDGESDSATIPSELLPAHLPKQFTISTWMKHEAIDNHTNAKEHIICNADETDKDRHHWSLFVRNCRLIFLLRRDYHSGNLNTFKPAEWRWKLKETCDNEWHHYSLLFNTSSHVNLYVDGVQREDSDVQVIDDWPLHPMKDDVTRTVVGACWRGVERHMDWYFNGYLAGLTMLRDELESKDVLKCLVGCEEGLTKQDADDEVKEEVKVTATDAARAEVEMRQVAYKNNRHYPTPGRRSLTINTDIKCSNGNDVKVMPVTMSMLVLEPSIPEITLSGTPNLARDYDQLKMGAKLFEDVSIVVSNQPVHEGVDGNTDTQIDACVISVDPALNPDHEYLTVPTNLLRELDMTVSAMTSGLKLSGADRIYNYEDVLRQVHYYNRKPEYYLTRDFTLVCSEMEGRYTSNTFRMEMSVIHSEPKEPVHAHLRQEDKITVDGSKANTDLLMDSNDVSTSAPNHAVAVIVVVCVGFLMFMIILGVIRIRAAHQKAQQEADDDNKQEMAWDDSSLTITVNPMQAEETAPNSSHIDMISSDDDDDDDDDDSLDYNEEDVSSDDDDDDEIDVGKTSLGSHPPHATHNNHSKKDLEWDDSTLTF